MIPAHQAGFRNRFKRLCTPLGRTLRKMFPLNRDALSRIVTPESLRWIAFGHFEADECGAMNEWLAVAPHATPAHGRTCCMVSLQRFRGSHAARTEGRRDHRARRRQACPLPRHAAHPARLGRRRALRGVDANTAVRRPFHPARQRPCADRCRGSSGRRSRRRTCSSIPASTRAWARRSAASPSSRRARWRSCTVPLSRATAPPPLAPWRMTTTAVFPVRRSRPFGSKELGPMP